MEPSHCSESDVLSRKALVAEPRRLQIYEGQLPSSDLRKLSAELLLGGFRRSP